MTEQFTDAILNDLLVTFLCAKDSDILFVKDFYILRAKTFIIIFICQRLSFYSTLSDIILFILLVYNSQCTTHWGAKCTSLAF